MTNFLSEALSFWIHFTLVFCTRGIKATEPYQKKVGGETCHAWIEKTKKMYTVEWRLGLICELITRSLVLSTCVLVQDTPSTT